MRLLGLLFAPEFNWTVLIVSNDPDVMQLCHRTLLLQEGQLVASGPFAEMRQRHELQDLITIPV